MIIFNSKNYKDLMIRDIKRLVDIPSVIGKEELGSPFGKAIRDALDEACIISNELGFRSYVDPDGYYAYADVGEGDELVGILGHLDVVPADDVENWNSNPFVAQVIDDNLYGRGTQDDKGPMICAMYATKYLLDNNYKINKRLRFIFGSDEENLWRGISKYMEKEEKPSFGFTPDSIFPLIHAEKGLLQVLLRGEGNNEFSIRAGNAFNSVPDKAYVEIDDGRFKTNLDNLGYEYSDYDGIITVHGKASHSAKPEYGINAITRAVRALNNIVSSSNAVKFINDIIGTSYHGENIIGEYEDLSGKLTLNVGKIISNKDIEEISLDIRIPVTYDKAKLVDLLKSKSENYDLEYSEYDYLKSIYVPEDNFLVKSLMDVIEEVTDFDSKPLTSGGATYARAMENCVAFGAVLPGRPKTEHQANEYINTDDLMKCTEIYINAIHKLTN